jgi:DNA-binding MarR family transcriptional regulator/GNAT superfamily N-acetyltransferase
MEATMSDQIEEIRSFNRFYTHRLGTLNEGLLDSSLTLTQVRILWELDQADGTSAVELCRRLSLDASYLSRILAEFSDKGWIVRSPSPDDARKSRLTLTEAGRKVFAPLSEASRRQIAEWLKPLGEPDREQLVAAMHSVMRLLDADAAKKPPMVVLRAHRPGDIGWIIERQAKLYAEEYGWNSEFEALVSEICARFLRRYDPVREHCWIAEADGRRVGSVTLVAKSKTVAQFRMLFVEGEARGLGIGGKLIEECLAFSRQAGYRKIVLWTNDCLRSARRLYEAAGFQLAKSEQHHSFGHDLVGQYWEKNL